MHSFNFPSTPLNQLDIRLSKLKPVKQFRNKVEGQVNPSTAAVMVVGKGLTATATGNYSLTSGASIKIFEDDVIEVSTVPPSTLPTKGVIEYYPVRVPLEGYPAININLEAKIQKLDPLTTNDQINIKINPLGFELGELSFKVKGAGIQPTKKPDGLFEFKGITANGLAKKILDNGLTIILDDFNTLNISANQLSIKDNIRIAFYKNIQTKNVNASADGSIKGKIQDGTIINRPLPNVKINARSASSDYYISTLSALYLTE